MEDEQLKNSFTFSNYQAQFPQLPHAQFSQASVQPPNQATHVPQFPRAQYNQAAAQPPNQPIIQSQPQHPPNHHIQPTNTMHIPNHQRPIPTNNNSMDFLLKAIRDLKSDLGKEIAEIRQNLSTQAHNSSRPQTITTNAMHQPHNIGMAPNQTMLPYHQPHLVMQVPHQLVPSQ